MGSVSQAQSSSSRLYKDIAQSIKLLKGTVFLNVTEGTWKTKIPSGTVLVMRFASNTVVRADVDYEEGVLKSATLTFNPAVHIWVKDPHNGFSASVDAISYDELGEATPHMTLDNHGTANPNLVQKLDRGLRMSRTPDGILLGNPLTSLAPSQPCTDVNATTCSAATPFITEVRFELIDPAHPGLQVLLKDGSTLHFSSHNATGTTFDNSVTAIGGSGFTFSQIDYTTNDKVLFAVIDNFDVQMQSGVLNSKDLGLVFGTGSRLTFKNVTLNRNGGSASISTAAGHLTATVGLGSSVNLSTGTANPSNLVFANGSQVDLTGFSIGIDDSQRTDVTIGGGSTMAIQVASGRLGIGSDGFLSLSSGSVAGELDGEWDSSAHDGPRSDLKITVIDAKVDGGAIDLNADSHLKITSGALKASNLLFRSFEFAGLTGAISTLNLVLNEDDTFGIPGGIQVVTNAGATLTAATPEDPLVFQAGASFPTGMATLDLPYKKLSNSKITSMVLRSGKAHINVANRPDGTIMGDHGSLNGTGIMSGGDLTLTAIFDVTELSIHKEPAKTPVIHGFFTGTIKKIDITYTSAPIYHVPGHDDQRIYPVTATLNLSNDLIIPQSTIAFDNLGFSFKSLTGGTIDIPVAAQLIVPLGRGEHQQPDDQDSTADGTHGPDQDQHRQEVATDTFPACRVHLYAIADTYNVTAKMHMLASAGVLSFSMTDFQTDRQIGYDKDGCDASVILAIAGAIGGTVFAGPAGTVIGAGAGYVAGGDLNNMINARINAVILEKIQGLQFAWHFQI
jgi:hypothetical protein